MHLLSSLNFPSMPLLLTKYFVGVNFGQGTGFSLFITLENGPSYQSFDTQLAKFCKCTIFTIYALWIFRKMGFGVIPHITRVFFLIPWRFFPGFEFSWYKEHVTNVTQDVKITWKMEGLPYQWQKVAYSGAQERGGFPCKQFCKNFLVLVLGFKKTYLVGLVLWPPTL